MTKNFPVLILFIFLFALQLKADYYAPAQNAKTHLWGYINQDGKKVIKFKYRLAFNFSYGKAIVLRDKWYYLDKENLKEHVFDDTLQGYFNAVIKEELKSEKLKYYSRDSTWIVYNLLSPPDEFFSSTEFKDYHLFHFSENNILLLKNNFEKS